MRIISGINRGRKLKEFNYMNIRPTSDVVKEAVFSKLQNIIEGSVFLDLFGGTGSIGFEAESRGAKVYICDNHFNSIKLINENKELLKSNASIFKFDYKVALEYFYKKGVKFDVIYVDPPFKKGLYTTVLELIIQYNLLLENGIVILEYDKKDKINIPQTYEVFDEKIYGSKKIDYLTIN